MPSRGGQPRATITAPATSAVRTVAIRPHMSGIRRARETTHASTDGTTIDAAAIAHEP